MPGNNNSNSEQQTKLITLDNLSTYTGYIEEKNIQVTRAQYDDLPSTKLTDGKSYYITDEGIIIKNGVTYGDASGTDTTYTLSAGTGDDANKIILTSSSGNPDKVTVPYATNAGTVNSHTVASDVPANAVFTDNNTTYGLSVGTGDDANKVILTPSTGNADKITVPYATSAGDAGTVNGKTVAVNVPADAVFTDTTYSDATTSASGLMSASDKTTINSLGTAAFRDIPTSGNASTSEVVLGTDSRLTDARPASDVSSWAKASTKPTYTASEVGAIATTAKGANNGVAELDSTGKVPSSQLPSYVDDVLEYNNKSSFPSTGESGKIYIAKDTNKTYRWSGSAYVEISESLALGETDSTAYRGDRGKTAYNHSQLTSGNPHNVSKSDVGLGNVTNDKQVKGLSSGTTENHVVTFGTDGYTVKDSGYTIGKSVPSDALFTDTTYSAASDSGISLNSSTKEFSNSGVRSVTSGTTAQGTMSVNINGTSADVGLKGVYYGIVGTINPPELWIVGSVSSIDATVEAPISSFSSGDKLILFFYQGYIKNSSSSNSVSLKINSGDYDPVYYGSNRLTLSDTFSFKPGMTYTFTRGTYSHATGYLPCWFLDNINPNFASNVLSQTVTGGLSGSNVQAQLDDAGNKIKYSKFIGTTIEWNALSTATKKKYDEVLLTDD